jgi:hypothetical protein
MLSNRNESPENLVLMEGYFNVKCQKNANTMKLRDNQRMILGSYAYHITGFTDFFEEFTGDDESAHVINLTVRREEPEEHDDLVNHIADGLLFTWGAEITGPGSVSVDKETGLTAHMLKNGENVPESAVLPMTWNWTSSDETVATVDADGFVRGVSEGEAVITANLSENLDLAATFTISVNAGSEAVRFVGTVPPFIAQYSEITLTAVHEVNGEATEDPLEWSFAGADPEDWAAFTNPNGMQCEIACNSPASEPLIVTISYGGESASVSIKLLGY